MKKSRLASTVVEIADEVADALARGTGIVALETAVVSHGLPTATHALQAAHRMTAAVRDHHAIPAFVGVLDGRLRIGLTEAELDRLATDPARRKLSSRDLAPAAVGGLTGGTTVAATLEACRIAGISVFATGGIGGVHRGEGTHDVSADLHSIARTRCCIVCSGPKAVLNVTATLEALESLGVPVLGWQSKTCPQFWSRGTEEVTVPWPIETVADLAKVCTTRWNVYDQHGIVLANPVPQHAAISHQEIEAAVTAAEDQAALQGVHGPALTPFLLAAVARLTAGRTLTANVALLESNARLAGELAVQLSATRAKAVADAADSSTP